MMLHLLYLGLYLAFWLLLSVGVLASDQFQAKPDTESSWNSVLVPIILMFWPLVILVLTVIGTWKFVFISVPKKIRKKILN